LDTLFAVDQKARVDSWQKLTLGKLVNKSTHHVRQVDYFSSGCRVRVRVMAKRWLYSEFQSKTGWSWQL